MHEEHILSHLTSGFLKIGLLGVFILGIGLTEKQVSFQNVIPETFGASVQSFYTTTSNDADNLPSQKITHCAPSSVALGRRIPEDHYLKFQFVQSVGGRQAVCQINSSGTVDIAVNGEKRTCNPYPGESGEGGSANCPTAVISRDVGEENATLICWEESPVACATDLTDLEMVSELSNLEENLSPSGAWSEDISLDDNTVENPTVGGNQYEDVIGKIYEDTPTARIAPEDYTEYERFVVEQNQAAFPGSEVYIENGELVVEIEESNLSGTYSETRYLRTPLDEATPTGFTPFSGGRESEAIVTPTPVAVGGNNPVPASDSGVFSRTGAGTSPTSDSVYRTQGNGSFSNGGFPNTQPYSQSQTVIRGFVNSGGIIDTFANFITGKGRVSRNTPKGDTEVETTIQQPEFVVPELTDTGLRDIKEIASDIAAQTSIVEVSRVDHFAQTLSLVGGPNEVNTENKSFGRIQDLIIEDEAIRSLRLAEEEGKRAKNTTYCRAFETGEDCLERREARAKVVEREVFVAELEKRVLPENAVLHFLAVYDGWVRPTPAPKTHATSTLGVLHTQEGTLLEDYEVTTDGKNFVSRIIGSIKEAASDAVSTLTNLMTGTETVFEDTPSN